MKFLDKMERKIGKYAIPRLPLIMTGCFIVGYIFRYFFETVYVYLTLDPAYMVENNQWWRLITWIFTVPFELNDTLSMLLTPICLYFYYYIGTSLERLWGKFAFNLYVFSEIILTDLAVVIVYLITKTPNLAFIYLPTTRYMLLSMFLAMAVVFKDQVVLFAFVVPMKMKWLAVVDAAFMLYEFINYPFLYWRVVIITCCVTFGIFWLIYHNRNGMTHDQKRRARRFKQAVREGRVDREHSEVMSRSADGKVITMRPSTKGPIHQCTICGRTERDNQDLEFRYCSKCAGNHEYCSDHIFSHVHIKESEE